MWFINRLSLQCPGVSVYQYRFEPKTSYFPLKYRTRSCFLQLNRLHFSIKKSSSAPPLLLFCYKGNYRVYPHPSFGQISVTNAFCGTVNIMRGTYFRPIFPHFWRGKIKGRHLINQFQVRIQRGDRGSRPPGKSQVIWVSIGNIKQLDPPPGKVGPPLENVGPLWNLEK